MAYAEIWADGGRGAIRTFTGRLTEGDIQSVMTYVAAHPERLKNTIYTIHDFSHVVEIDISSKFIIHSADQAVFLSGLNRHLCFVFVVPTALELGLAQMWATYAEKTGWPVQCVKTRKEAEVWLRQQLGDDLTFSV